MRLAIFAPSPSWLPLAFVKNDTTVGGKTDVNRVTWVQRTDHLSIDGPKQSWATPITPLESAVLSH